MRFPPHTCSQQREPVHSPYGWPHATDPTDPADHPADPADPTAATDPAALEALRDWELWNASKMLVDGRRCSRFTFGAGVDQPRSKPPVCPSLELSDQAKLESLVSSMNCTRVSYDAPPHVHTRVKQGQMQVGAQPRCYQDESKRTKTTSW